MDDDRTVLVEEDKNVTMLVADDDNATMLVNDGSGVTELVYAEGYNAELSEDDRIVTERLYEDDGTPVGTAASEGSENKNGDGAWEETTASKVEDEPRYLKQGTVLKGRYRISHVVGAGGFGVTYAVWDMTLQQRVAVKEYLPGEFSTRMPGTTHVTVYGGEKEEQYRDGLEKYLEESRRLALLRNVSGIVQIFDSFNENETAYIVMEFLDGETLSERLEREKRLEPEEAVRIMLPVLEALKEVHKENILHRDIAPNNIFLCKDGRVKLLDFGAARSVTGTYSKSLTVLYKEGYTAEEQYRSKGEQGPWTDVYACAATLYKMITGEVPEGAMERRRKDTLKPPSKCGVKLSANVEHAIMNALNLDVSRRTRTAEDFARELESTGGVKNNFVRSEERREGRIPPWIWVAAGAVTAALVVLVVLGTTGAVDFHAEGFSNLFVADGKTRVMNVVNLEQEEAVDRLAAINLSMEVTDVKYSNRVLEGRIISQEEKKGSIVDADSTVHVVVSKGAGVVEVPEMVGREWSEVKAELDDLCLEYDMTREESIEAPDFVIAQGTEAGVGLEQGETVSVVVSSGMGYDKNSVWEMEDLSGLSYSDARSLLSSHGIYARMTGEEYSDDILADGVASQNISAGAEVHGEDVVELTMSLGPAPVDMPELSGVARAEAEETLSGLGLAANVTEQESDGEAGVVLSQSEPAGATVHRGDSIDLTVSVRRRVVAAPPAQTAQQEPEQAAQQPAQQRSTAEDDLEAWNRFQEMLRAAEAEAAAQAAAEAAAASGGNNGGGGGSSGGGGGSSGGGGRSGGSSGGGGGSESDSGLGGGGGGGGGSESDSGL